MRQYSVRLVFYLAGLLMPIAPAAMAGTFSINAWTNDASSGIVAGQTLWAYHFATTNIATVNGVTVPGTGTNENPAVVGRFAIGGLSFVFPNDGNNLTALGGSGSAVVARGFLYGGAPRLITVEGLITGQVYTVSIYGVGFDAPNVRASNFTNGTDTLYLDENSVGNDVGLRVDYTFAATATTNLTIIMPTNDNSFHVYALVLRQPLLVTTTSNTGPGSLRQAVLDAAVIPGPDTITFAPALSGTTITLGSEIVLENDVTIDATSLSNGLTVSGGNTTRIFSVNSGQTASLLGLTFSGGNGIGLLSSGFGGVIYNSGTLTLTQCTFSNNSCSGGGGIGNASGTLTLTHCTLSGNSANFGGAIASFNGLVTLRHCTLAFNHSIGPSAGADGGGAIDNYGDGTLTLTACILAGNTAVTANGPELWMEDGTLIATHCLFGNGTSSTLVNGVNGNLVGTSGSPVNALLAPLGNYGGATKTMPPLPGSPAIDAAGVIDGLATEQRGSARNVGTAPDIGAVESGGLWVQNNNDSGVNSLREVVANSASVTNSKTILFTTNLSGATIGLNSQILVTDTYGITVDASALPGGVQIDGNAVTRVFYVTNDAVATLKSLTIANGREISGTLANNRGGGGIFSRGRIALVNCCVVSNEVFTSPINPSFGGGIACDTSGDVRLTNCTVAFNQVFGAQSFGGAFYNLGTFVAEHCTVVSNLTASGNNGGYAADGTTSLHATVLANGGTDFNNLVGGISLGNNLISDGSGSGLTNGANGDQIGTAGSPLNPLLAALGNYGGPTQTMPPLPGSPAIDAAGASGVVTDQRGFPRPIGLAADIGAVEGLFNPAGPSVLTGLTKLGNGTILFGFTNYSGMSYTVLASTNVAASVNTWSNIGLAAEPVPGSGQFQFTDLQATNYSRRFYRVRSP